MAVRRFAALVGIVFLLLGLLGFMFTNLFWVFKFHTAHNVIHLLVGLAGMAASFDRGVSFRFSKLLGIFYIVMAVLGVFTKDLFGLLPQGIAENALYFFTGAIALYFGYVLMEENESAQSRKPRRTRAI